MNSRVESELVERDRFALTRKQLLDDYANISRKRRGAAEATSIRLQSRQYLDILAHQGTSGQLSWSELRRTAMTRWRSGSAVEDVDPTVLAQIGRVLLLHPVRSTDTGLGLFMLEQGTDEMPVNGHSRRFRQLVVQQYILDGRFSEANGLLDMWKDLTRIEHGYLRAEMLNPFTCSTSGDERAWLMQFNMTFTSHGLAPISLVDGECDPFDRVQVSLHPTEEPSEESSGSLSAPVVSVVVTAFEPGPVELITSVRSLLQQTLQQIEVIVVDDGSGSAFDGTFSAVDDLDERVTVIRLKDNVGTYAARNVGYSHCSGAFVTGQDDDDWSHPQRLEVQVAFLNENPSSAGCRVSSITCTPDLSRLRLGYRPTSSNASSLMFRRSLFERAGGFIEMRKAADTEFMRRLEHIANSAVEDLDQPLSLVRILPDSLSRSEFRAGWSHPARRQIKSSYQHWHSTASIRDLHVRPGANVPVHIPRRFRRSNQGSISDYDVILAGDWRQFGGPQKSMIEEIRALNSAGFRVAILHMEAPRFMSTVQKPMTAHIQELVNSGVVDEVLYDDAVSARLLILRYPPILQFAPDAPSAIEIDRMLIMANQAPSELDGRDIRYLVADCHENARRIFTKNVTWVPQGPQVREAISPYLSAGDLEALDVPGILDPSEWAAPYPRRFRSTAPVIGRHSRDNAMKWPEDPVAMESVYPTDGSIDVRVMGGTQVAQTVLGRSSSPAAWVSYPTDSMPVREFLWTLDFFVFFQHSIAVEAFGRAILEAIAAGLVVILPKHYEEVFGEAAIYAEPDDVVAVVRRYRADQDRYNEQRIRAEEVLRDRFTHQAYATRIKALVIPREKSGEPGD